MNKMYKLIPITLALLLLAIPAQRVMGQNADSIQDEDIMWVPWLDDNDELLINSLYEAIVSDTVDGGERANTNRVYMLEQGGFYYNTERIENSGWPLRIIGEPGDPNDEFANPPMIQLEHRDDGSRTDKILVGGGDVTLQNLIINGKTTLGDLPYEIIRFDGENSLVVIDNVIFEYAQWAIIAFYGKDSEILITNSVFRNLLSTYQPWGGRGLSVWADTEKLHIENNTFFNIGGFSIQVEGAVARDLWINHNTFVNVGRTAVLGWHLNSYFTNNLIVNGWWHGEGEEGFDSIRLEEEDNQFTGMLGIGPLPTRYGLDAQRIVVISNNSNYRAQAFEDYYAATANDDFPLRSQPFVNQRTLNYAAEFDNIIIDNTFDGADPGLANFAQNYDEMIAFITAVRAEDENIPLWYWDPDRDPSNYSIQWPLPEDLSYSNSVHQGAGVGGFPLGDLNWFPAEKTQWETQKETLEEQIRNKVGEPPVITNVGRIEAEDGVLTGDAEIKSPEDSLYVRVEASGDIKWTFDMDAAGTYDVVIKKRSWWEVVNPERETNLVVNDGDAINVPAGSDLVEDDPQPWAVPKVEGVAFVEGENTLKLVRNWGYLEYENVTIQTSDGTVVKTLWPGVAELIDGGEYRCGGEACASGDQYVDITGGGLEVGFDSEAGGNHSIIVDYLLLEGSSASVEVKINGNNSQVIDIEGETGEFAKFTVSDVRLTAGNNVISFESVSGNIGLDVMEFFLIGTPTSSEIADLPDGFELGQNYPNPFNPSTSISFSIPVSGDVTLEVFNLLGQRVATLASGLHTSGSHTVQFDASQFASGVYLYRMTAGNHTAVRKMLLIK